MELTGDRRAFSLAGGAACAALASRAAAAQGSGRISVDPRVFGLDIPAGPLRAGGGRTFLTGDNAGESAVVRSVASVGSHELVLLPDGQIVVRAARECPPTERPFAPLDKEALARRLSVGDLKGFKTKLTKRYLFLYNSSEEFALVTSRILESMVPGLIEFGKNMNVKVAEPELPLVVIIFRTHDEFSRYRPGLPAGLVAYYHVLDNRVAMYEESQFAAFNKELAVEQALSTIAHEGAHQILHNIGVQQRLSLWPMWMAEGIAEYLAPTTLGRNLGWKGAGKVNDWRMFELERYLKTRAADAAADGSVIADVVSAARLSSTGYAAAWALTHYLIANERAKFIKLFTELSQLAPLADDGELAVGTPAANRRQFEQTFGADLKLLEKRMIGHLTKQPYDDPFASYPHWVAMVTTFPSRRTKREAEVFLSYQDAQVWQRDQLARQSEALKLDAISDLRRFGSRAAAEGFMAQWKKG